MPPSSRIRMAPRHARVAAGIPACRVGVLIREPSNAGSHWPATRGRTLRPNGDDCGVDEVPIAHHLSVGEVQRAVRPRCEHSIPCTIGFELGWARVKSAAVELNHEPPVDQQVDTDARGHHHLQVRLDARPPQAHPCNRLDAALSTAINEPENAATTGRGGQQLAQTSSRDGRLIQRRVDNRDRQLDRLAVYDLCEALPQRADRFASRAWGGKLMEIDPRTGCTL